MYWSNELLPVSDDVFVLAQSIINETKLQQIIQSSSYSVTIQKSCGPVYWKFDFRTGTAAKYRGCNPNERTFRKSFRDGAQIQQESLFLSFTKRDGTCNGNDLPGTSSVHAKQRLVLKFCNYPSEVKEQTFFHHKASS